MRRQRSDHLIRVIRVIAWSCMGVCCSRGADGKQRRVEEDGGGSNPAGHWLSVALLPKMLSQLLGCGGLEECNKGGSSPSSTSVWIEEGEKKGNLKEEEEGQKRGEQRREARGHCEGEKEVGKWQERRREEGEEVNLHILERAGFFIKKRLKLIYACALLTHCTLWLC